MLLGNAVGLSINNSGTAINAHSAIALGLTGCGSASCGSGGINWNTSVANPTIFPTAVSQTIGGVTYTGITCTAAIPCPTGGTATNLQEPYAAAWNLDIQRAITNNLTVDVAYVGNRGFDEILYYLARKIHDFRNTKGLPMVQIR